VAFLHAEAGGIEFRSVAHHSEQDRAKPMGHRDDGGLVAAPDRDPRKVRIERVRPALGDVPVSIAVTAHDRARS
jgi:hypothetical protein